MCAQTWDFWMLSGGKLNELIARNAASATLDRDETCAIPSSQKLMDETWHAHICPLNIAVTVLAYYQHIPNRNTHQSCRELCVSDSVWYILSHTPIRIAKSTQNTNQSKSRNDKLLVQKLFMKWTHLYYIICYMNFVHFINSSAEPRCPRSQARSRIPTTCRDETDCELHLKGLEEPAELCAASL